MKKIFLTLSLALGLAAATRAQGTQTAYFLDNYVYSYRLNPAMPYYRSFVGLLLGNYDVSTQSSLGISSLVFPTENGLVTAFNKAVTSEQMLSRLSDLNGIHESADISILSTGWWTRKNSFCTLEFNLHQAGGFGIPKDFFAFVKNGSSPAPYDLSNLYSDINAYADIAFGYTRPIGRKVTVGGRAKLLVGLARAGVNFDKALLAVNDQMISSEIEASFKIATPLVDLPLKPLSEQPDSRVYDFSKLGLNMVNPGVAGWGFALDLGATYRPFKGFEVSASVLNLGGIAWKDNILGHSAASIKYTGITKEDDKMSADLLNDSFTGIKESFDDILSLTDMIPDDPRTDFDMLPVVFNAGVRYAMPFYDKLSAGVLVTGRTGRSGYFDARAAATISPIHWFSFTANAGVGSYGPTFGTGLSVSAGPFNLFAAFDGYMGKFSPYTMKFGEEIGEAAGARFYIPLNKFHFNLNFGLTIVFGTKHFKNHSMADNAK